MNPYNFPKDALKAIGLIALIIGGLITAISLIIYAVALNSSSFDGPDTAGAAGAAGWAEIGAFVFAVGILGTLLWLHAESIAAGQVAMVAALTPVPETPREIIARVQGDDVV